ncbi:GTP-binding protein, putative [Plasmodium ovale]|uniref:GTP-binding protein, putative n=1 Tax=Plasmodium ovale TaxID=36330 RepID=A0A1C3KS94_PLAOA|nr:GTP-binding protein, putative [Plasmodium ovale]
MRLSPLLLRKSSQFEKRHFSSSLTKGNGSGRKNEIIVLHPILKKIKSDKSFDEIIYDAQEALGLARSAGFKIASGISMPSGGWTFTAESNSGREKNEGQDIHSSVAEGGKCLYDTGSFDEIEKKIAESILIKVNRVDNKFFFSKGKLNELSRYFLKNPTPYIFINTILSPEQFRNIDFLFNNLLKSYHDELKLMSEKRSEGNFLSKRTLDSVLDVGNTKELDNRSCGYFDLYNNYSHAEDDNDVGEDDQMMEDNYDEEKNDGDVDIAESDRQRGVPMYVELLDRYSIILYILKSRAKSNLSKLQLELARANFIFTTYSENNKSRMKYIKYVENNILGKCHFDYEEKSNQVNIYDVEKQKNKKKNFDYLGYTSNYIKSTETYKEYEKRIINNLYIKLRKELKICKNNNNLQNSARKHKALIAVVGYTNVGKTQLINYLTKSNLKSRNILFQTLDNTYKNLNISNSFSTIFIDSIGFIQDVPYSLYESFKISLDAIKNSDIVIHIIDISHPYKDKHKKCVIDTLKKIGISDEFIKNNIIEVWNKIDKLKEKQLYQLYKDKPKNVLPISAKYGINCDALIHIIKNLTNHIKNVQVLTLIFPTKEAKERISYLTKNFKVIPDSISYSTDGNTTFIRVVDNPSNLKRYYTEFENHPERSDH